MANISDSALTVLADQIQDETTAGANTALRIGTFLNDIVDSKINHADLSNVNNTSDVNKPVSTAQAAADVAVSTAANSYATSFILAATGNPRLYKAYVGQASTAAPIAAIVANTFIGSPTWSRTSTGVYVITFTGVFTVFKTFIPRLLQFYPGGSTNIIKITITQDSVNTITIRTYLGALGSEVLTDGVLTTVNFDIEIYVYP